MDTMDTDKYTFYVIDYHEKLNGRDFIFKFSNPKAALEVFRNTYDSSIVVVNKFDEDDYKNLLFESYAVTAEVDISEILNRYWNEIKQDRNFKLFVYKVLGILESLSRDSSFLYTKSRELECQAERLEIFKTPSPSEFIEWMTSNSY